MPSHSRVSVPVITFYIVSQVSLAVATAIAGDDASKGSKKDGKKESKDKSEDDNKPKGKNLLKSPLTVDERNAIIALAVFAGLSILLLLFLCCFGNSIKRRIDARSEAKRKQAQFDNETVVAQTASPTGTTRPPAPLSTVPELPSAQRIGATVAPVRNEQTPMATPLSAPPYSQSNYAQKMFSANPMNRLKDKIAPSGRPSQDQQGVWNAAMQNTTPVEPPLGPNTAQGYNPYMYQSNYNTPAYGRPSQSFETRQYP